MARTSGRGFIPCHSVLYENREEEKDNYIKTASRLSMARLKTKLCSLGPNRCPECGLCAYGKEYVKRSQRHEEMGVIIHEADL